ncbi:MULTISPECIES: YidC/Oxa1 family membrane protein insertase [unclassified Ruminococcus]|uniref:YidC/Oxa1 family membrane protein insertase n=1 Tax=unclassified Ruminococcus TaxID=2608920 RepID=UPI00210DCD6B|nr:MULTISPECIES: YidC/Oxa1 family membrane protein insertase [unclassified Ruminococcus]MCQ4021957.1 membrane protein insertase YidC [Ruminococcus sp. zg-924]MCQ4114493.1 membrane protein insertase YidC [Ruminococcus sp. zg-921]
MDIFNFIGSLLGYVLYFCFMIVKNYAWAIVLFTIIIKAVLFPTSIKQQKNMAKNARMAAKQRELQEKYGNDRVKLNEELQKLQQREGVSPTSGCLTTMALPMILLFGIYYSVINPLTNTLHFAAESVNNCVSYLNTLPGIGNSFNNFYGQIDILKLAQSNEGVTYLNGFFSADQISQIKEFGASCNLFGLDLLGRPNIGGFNPFTNPLILIPVFCLISSLAAQLITMRIQSKNTGTKQPGCMMVMFLFMPLISVYISYTVPAAVGFYWIISTLLGLVQSLILQKFYNVNIMTAKAEAQRVALLDVNEAKVKYEYNPRIRNNSELNNNTNNGKNSAKKKSGKKK